MISYLLSGPHKLPQRPAAIAIDALLNSLRVNTPIGANHRAAAQLSLHMNLRERLHINRRTHNRQGAGHKLAALHSIHNPHTLPVTRHKLPLPRQLRPD